MSSKVRRLLRELPSDDEEPSQDADAGSAVDADAEAAKPWLHDFNGYLHSTDNLGGLSVVEWWGVS